MEEPTEPARSPARRRAPLVAPTRVAPSAGAGPDGPRSASRGLWVGLGVGLALAVAVGALVFSVAAIPLFLFAQVAPDGRDRPEVKTALVVSIYVGAAIGAVVGVAVGVWAGRGGRLPTHASVGFSDRPE